MRETSMAKVRATAAAQREVIRSGRVETAIAEKTAEADRVLGEVAQLSRIPLELLGTRDAHMAAFEAKVGRLRQKAWRNGDVAALESSIVRMRELDRWTWDVLITRALSVIKRQW